jgi:hypothetical protein
VCGGSSRRRLCTHHPATQRVPCRCTLLLGPPRAAIVLCVHDRRFQDLLKAGTHTDYLVVAVACTPAIDIAWPSEAPWSHAGRGRNEHGTKRGSVTCMVVGFRSRRVGAWSTCPLLDTSGCCDTDPTGPSASAQPRSECLTSQRAHMTSPSSCRVIVGGRNSAARGGADGCRPVLVGR